MYNPEQYSQVMEHSIIAARLTSKVGFGLLDYIVQNYITTEYKAISQLMLQMALVKLESIISLIENPINILASNEKIQYVDPMSLVCIERAIYELLAMHHFLFIENHTKEQKEFAVKIWKVSGLTNRNNIALNGDDQKKYQSKQEKEQEFINSLLTEIHNSRFYTETNEKGRKKIDDSCKKLKPIFVKEEEGKIEIVSVTFAEAHKYLYPHNSEYSIDNFIYKMMSFQSHPSFLAILQFGQQDKASDSYWTTTVKGATHYCAKLIKEIAIVIPETTPIVNQLNKENCSIIDRRYWK